MKTKQRRQKRARQTYTITWAVKLTSIANLNVYATTAFVTQFVVALSELAVPITWSGYISELIVQGVELMPKAKQRRNSEIPIVAIRPPYWAVSLASSIAEPLYAMPMAVMSQARAAKGIERRIMYLLPSLSMKKIARMVPKAFISDKTM